MAKTLLALCILSAFFVRDLRLLVAAGRSRIATVCTVYAVLFILYAAALGALLSHTQIQEPYLITIDERLWAGVVGVHVVLCGLTWWLSRSDSRRAWLIALAFSGSIALPLPGDCRLARRDRD
jgi:hypothetical protein